MESITLKTPEKGEEKAHDCANAFHEKAGGSQVDSRLLASWNNVFSSRGATVAMLPFALSRSDQFARCMLGVLGSAGAAT